MGLYHEVERDEHVIERFTLKLSYLRTNSTTHGGLSLKTKKRFPIQNAPQTVASKEDMTYKPLNLGAIL